MDTQHLQFAREKGRMRAEVAASEQWLCSEENEKVECYKRLCLPDFVVSHDILQPAHLPMKNSSFLLPVALLALKICQAAPGGRNRGQSGHGGREPFQEHEYPEGQPEQAGEEDHFPFGHEQPLYTDSFGGMYRPSYQPPSINLPASAFLPVDFSEREDGGLQQHEQEYDMPPPQTSGRRHHPASLGSSQNQFRPQNQVYDMPPPASFSAYDSHAFHDLTQQTAAMQLGGLAPIHTGERHGYGEEIHPGSMTSRARKSGSKSKGASQGRLPKEPQTARSARPSRLTQEEGEGGDGEEEKEGSKSITPELAEQCREIVEREWRKSNVRSAEDVARQVGEIKIQNPGYERDINSIVRRVAQSLVPNEWELYYLDDLVIETNRCSKAMIYYKNRFVRNHPGSKKEDMPIPLLLQQFRTARVNEKKRKEDKLRNQRQEEEWHESQAAQEREGGAVDPETILAQNVWNDFMASMINPALRDGYQYSMHLVGFLLSRYVHEEYSPEVTQHYIVQYLQDVQGASSAEIGEMRQALANAASEAPPQQQSIQGESSSRAGRRKGRGGSRGWRGWD